MQRHDPAGVPPHELDYLLQDLVGVWTRVAANEGWFRQQWLGVPIWQLPGDLMRLQRAVSQVRPTWIVETGTKFGGSAIFFASLLRLLGNEAGGVLTVDITQTREASEHFQRHPLGPLVRSYRIGNAADQDLVAEIEAQVRTVTGPVLVFLDDNHNAEHVLQEMRLYSRLVTPGSYLIVADTVFAELGGSPVGRATERYPDVASSNPRVAVERFLGETQALRRDESFAGPDPSNFPDGFLLRHG